MLKENKFIKILTSIIKIINKNKVKYKDNYNGYSNTNQKIVRAEYIKKERNKNKSLFEDSQILKDRLS